MPCKQLWATAALALAVLPGCAVQRQAVTPGIVPRNVNGDPVLTGSSATQLPAAVR